MKLLYAFIMSFSTFCAIPCPIFVWDEKLRPMMTAVLPLVGLVIGCFWALLAAVFDYFELPRMLVAAVLTAAPWVLSGYIHLDGFMDTCDAVLSRRDLKERQRILKDPLTGAFAVISLVIITILSFGAFYEADLSNYIALALVPVITRSCSSIAVQTLKMIGHSKYADLEKKTFCIAFPAVILGLAIAVSAFNGIGAFICAISALIGWSIACFRGYKQLAGMSGDISGYSITVGEIFAVLAFAFI